ncbi:MAG: cupin domain-containing protein [Myxococcaceae bacterium]
MKKRLITEDDVEAAAAKGQRRISAPVAEAIVTPAAWTRAQELGIDISRGPGGSGLKVVRGGEVKLERFTGAGANRNVGLKDVVTAADRSPMGAGFMAWSAADSFPWHLTYDEIDYVLEGVLHITINGEVVEAKPGDVVFIPKGSHIVFGTPSSVRIFYVTHPANWGG